MSGQSAQSWIDVSRPLHDGMVQWPGDPRFRRWRVGEITGPGTSNISAIATSVHVGTHIDAPLHFIPGGADIEQLSLGVLCGEAVVHAMLEPRDIEPGDLDGADIRRGDRVLFKTANASLWARGEFDESFFGITEAAARRLVELGVVAVGVDYLSIDAFTRAGSPAHLVILGAGVVIVEGLDLDAVAPGRYEMVALPLRLRGSDGSPARVILRAMKACGRDASAWHPS